MGYNAQQSSSGQACQFQLAQRFQRTHLKMTQTRDDRPLLKQYEIKKTFKMVLTVEEYKPV